MNKRILRLAIPNILSNLSVPLLGIADTALMGRLESEVYLGAIALGGIIFNFIYWGFGYLRMGTVGMTAQAFGRNDRHEAELVLGRAWILALAGALLVLLAQFPIVELGFWMIEGGPEVERLARSYFYIRIWAAPATLSLYAFHGWFLGMQNARDPMVLTIFVNLVNIILNVIFVFGLDMAADGVALATVIAQYAGLGLALVFFKLRYGGFTTRIRWKGLSNWLALRHFFEVNANIFIRTMCLILTFTFFTAKSAEIDNLILAANQILLQYFYTMSFGVDGFAYAAESLTGRFTGAGDREKLKSAIRLLLIWGLGLGALFAGVYLLAGDPLLRVFTNQEAVIEAARPYLFWMSILALSGSAAFIWDGIYIGATATRPMRDTMLLATFAIFLPAYYLSFPVLGNHGLWMAMSLFMVARSILLSLTARRYIFNVEG